MRICAFIGDMYRDYSSAIIKRLQTRAVENGHRIDIFGNCAVPSDNPLHAEGLKSILNIPPLKTYDGIFLCSDTLHHAGLNRELLDNLMSATDIPPVISIRCDEEGFYNIVPDNRQLMYEITKHVLDVTEGGDIGFVTGRDDLVDSSERRAGFEDAMHEAGFEVKEDMIFHGNYWIDQGPETADFFIRKDKSLPSAIICSNDYMAIGLIDELVDRGYSIPQDVMITGVDNLPFSLNHIPSVTTSNISEEYLVDRAIECLENIKKGEDVDFLTTVPGQLIVRESTVGKTDRDVGAIYHQLDLIQKSYYDQTLAFVRLSSDFQDVMSKDNCVLLTLESISNLKLFKKIFLCLYGETDRILVGMSDGKKQKACNISFPMDDLLPSEYNKDFSGIRIYLPIHFKNEVYGHAVLETDTKVEGFFDERLEFMLLLFGQTLNRLQLYGKLFEVSDVMDLYIRDALTGIFNRRGFEKHISNILDRKNEENIKIAVASIDMDDLKSINDEYGHSAGDDAIKAIANCLTRSLNRNEFAARMGGDEFEAVLVLDNPGRIGQFIRSFRTEIKNANKKVKEGYTLSASVGTAEVESWGTLMESMNKADKIMYVEKKTKKHR
ncbi:MAG: GGDEF domain-containing protein [Clostridia bacterium]|nr:GGDEF domain-containing protein [Clostridia bacterium]